eukprot:scaffold9243_cov162-Amphora_coffeaeformis.AAC.11
MALLSLLLFAAVVVSSVEAFPTTIMRAMKNQTTEIAASRQLSASFSQTCDDFAKDFGSFTQSRCECNDRNQSVFCKMPPTCEHAQGCDRKICTSLMAQVSLKRHGSSYIVSSIALTADLRGSAYEGERTFLDDKNTCRQWFVINGIEYECNTCTLCEEGGVALDCSNIQPGAVNHQEGCSYTTSSSFSFWEYCPKEGAPDPKSPGRPVSSSSGIHSPSAGMKSLDNKVTKMAVVTMFWMLAL